MPVVSLHWKLHFFSNLFLAAAKSHACIYRHEWRFPNVFSNISAFQMINLIQCLCVTLRKMIARASSFLDIGEGTGISGSYLLGHHHIFFFFISFIPSPFFISSFCSNRRSLNSRKITYLYQGSDCEFILFWGSRKIM